MNGNKLTSIDIKGMLDLVKADREAKQVFLAMPREDQLLAILGMIAYNSNQNAQLQKSQAELSEDVDALRKENRTARRQRETLEKQLAEKMSINIHHDDDTTQLSTTEKVIAALSKRFGRLTNLLWGTAQTVFTLIILAILYLAFGGKIPGTP